MLFIIYFILLLLLFKLKRHKQYRSPPGPKGLPIIGNLHQFDNSKPYVYLAELAKTYGPILSLRFGRVPIIVVQSSKIAKEVLHTQDLNFCSRPSMIVFQKLSYGGLDIGFAPYGEYFREIKKISVVYLLSSKRVDSFTPMLQDEVARLMKKINSLSSSSKVINLSELLLGYSSSNICRIAFGKRYEDNEGSRSRFHSLLNEAQALFTAFFFSDYFPYSGWLDKLTGQYSRLDKTFKDLDAFFEEIISDHINPNKSESESDHEDIIDVLLHLKNQRCFEFSMNHIKAISMIIFIAGTDTSAAMVVWAMTELIKNANSLKIVQEELRNAAQKKGEGSIDKTDLANLEYFKAVVKETFRLHPAVPLLAVHESIKKSIIEGYDIQPKTQVYINEWAIGRDPKIWKEPDKFMPERFLESTIDFKGYDFELIPFGAGRRMCPGLNLGVTNIELALANLLIHFDWEIPPGLNRKDIDTDTLPGITMHKKNPLCLMVKPYL
ncbi:6,7,8-trihydroxycoumarin synthase-like [Amaranthus tricolor]|uniref:6,7,8-trihydroxycoumarin synthase-like n=1 Tax=Amaranthus tricolor TaxID=29722 RepID=UPI00258EAB79|nr:6,7,8-trihydroxycoumarin synthase-like [Amaranthus tricolor]